ncbi:MAG: nuclear transport factor 2 family protein [Flaviaesturariibacter sp.]|nr:nuclear transport factor 2 family protein [Flaviaesturariibacter sp.]
MKKGLLFFLLLFTLSSLAQGRDKIGVLASVIAVHQSIFVGKKDSSILEKLFAPVITYGHSSGKLEDRAAAIRAVIQNKSTYTDVQMGPVNLILNRKTAVTRYVLTGTEFNEEGKATQLKLDILQVWVRDGKNWKMIARQAVKVS